MQINSNSCRSRSTLPYIPDDVMFNIVLRLPSRSLIRFKYVCKAWHAIISSQFFVHAHLEQSKLKPSSVLMAPGFYKKHRNGQNFAFLMGLYKYQGNNIMQHLHDFPYDFPQVLDTWSHPVHCNGLLFVSDMKDKMLIYNPSTTEVVSLPNGSPNLYKGRGHGFGDNHNKRYKVTRVYYQRDYETLLLTCKCEVLTLRTNAWRQMEDPPYPIGSPVYVKGAIYWMVSRTSLHPEPPNNTLVQFCLTEERFSLLSRPCNMKPSCLTQVGDELYCGFFISEGLSLEIWRCSFGQKPKWTQHCAIQIPPYAIKRPVASPLVAFHGNCWHRIRSTSMTPKPVNWREYL
uniref:F-box domain-containing protein n=1 Tax=Oryza brachyantha TaxID=4533 RepID=J3NBM7_ORYBR